MALTNSYENCRLWPGKPTRNILQHKNAAILQRGRWICGSRKCGSGSSGTIL